MSMFKGNRGLLLVLVVALLLWVVVIVVWKVVYSGGL